MSIPPEHYVIRDVSVDAARGQVRVLRDRYWWCIDSDYRKAVFYVGRTKRPRVGSPQCNSNRAIVERIQVPFTDATICFIPMAFVPVEE